MLRCVCLLMVFFCSMPDPKPARVTLTARLLVGFSQKGDYVRKWVPELRNVPASAIHEPWRMTPAHREHLGCADYPRPIPGTRYTGGACMGALHGCQ